MCASLCPTHEEPGTTGYNLCIPGPSSVCCVENRPWVTLSHCIWVLGSLPRVSMYLPRPVNLYTDPVHNTHCEDQSHTSSCCSEHEPSQGEMMWRLDSERLVRQVAQTLKLWPGYIKSNDSKPPVTFTHNENDVRSTLEGTPCLLSFLLYNQANKSQTLPDYCSTQAISCPLSEQIIAKHHRLE